VKFIAGKKLMKFTEEDYIIKKRKLKSKKLLKRRLEKSLHNLSKGPNKTPRSPRYSLSG